jgi:hypothetical protein
MRFVRRHRVLIVLLRADPDPTLSVMFEDRFPRSIDIVEDEPVAPDPDRSA